MPETTPESRDKYIIAALAAGAITVDTKTGTIYTTKGHVKSTHPDSHGYRVVGLGGGGRGNAYVHRVVWIAANGPIAAGLQINHRNLRKNDNRLWNLEVVTPRENIGHYHRNPYYKGWLDSDVMNADPEFLLRLIHEDETLLDRGEDPIDEDAPRPAKSRHIYDRSWRNDPTRFNGGSGT